MEIIQRFAIDKIYSSPSEDRQFRFSLVRATKPKQPAFKSITIYNHNQTKLPDDQNKYHVYVIGGVTPKSLNLGSDVSTCACRKTGWINVAKDMNSRTFILQIYTEDGVNCPRENIYYKHGNDNALIFAIKVDETMTKNFTVDDFKYLRVYTNWYYDNLSNPSSIHIEGKQVVDRTSIAALQRKEIELSQNGGVILYYVNGYLVDRLSLEVPVGSYIEIMHDKTIDCVTRHRIGDLRTFTSRIDKRQKYYLYRERSTDFILYEDDLEIYLVGKCGDDCEEGVYFHQNLSTALRNLTDKDFSIDSQFVNQQARIIGLKTEQAIDDIEILVYTRRPPIDRSLIYNDLKLHELYKLPNDVEREVVVGSSYGCDAFRAEYLEDSNYFKIAGCLDRNNITKELATSTIGYGAASFYFGYTPTKVKNIETAEAPLLYYRNSIVYEYDAFGKMINAYPHKGPFYGIQNEGAYFLEYIQGDRLSNNTLYKNRDSVVLDKNEEYRIVKALYSGYDRLTDWECITDEVMSSLGASGRVSLELIPGERARVIPLFRIYQRDHYVDLSRDYPIIPILGETRLDGMVRQVPIDYYMDVIEVFVNGLRLIEGIDYFMDYPYIQICNKEFIDYSLEKQWIHIRGGGYSDSKEGVNDREIRGYVSHGTLARNNVYDIRDDRVYNVFIDGRLYDRDLVIYAEEDNTIRTANYMNGLPYVMSDRIISLREATGLPTMDYFLQNQQKDKEVRDLFTRIFPEPEIDEFQVIPDRHYLFSPLVSRVLRDMESGALSSSVYARRYTRGQIRSLIEERYLREWELDPTTKGLPEGLITIHPDYRRTAVEVTLHQYAFITDLVDWLTDGNPDLVNLSGFLVVTSDIDLVDKDTVLRPDTD